MRKTRHLLSKFCVQRYMRHYFIFWAPEIIMDQQVSRASDVWALGAILYILVTGTYPFDLNNEEQTMNNITHCNLNYRILINHPRVSYLLKNIFIIDPKERWTSDKILAYCQEDFAIIIQRFWRGSVARIQFKAQCHALVSIQSLIRGWLVKKKYNRRRLELRWQAATTI